MVSFTAFGSDLKSTLLYYRVEVFHRSEKGYRKVLFVPI
jgi:hypothetical protein